MGTIASLRHPMPLSSYAIRVGCNGCLPVRRTQTGMPAFSDPPHPSNCVLMGSASTFEHYQFFDAIEAPCSKIQGIFDRKER
jgi:hypothetical protein